MEVLYIYIEHCSIYFLQNLRLLGYCGVVARSRQFDRTNMEIINVWRIRVDLNTEIQNRTDIYEKIILLHQIDQ